MIELIYLILVNYLKIREMDKDKFDQYINSLLGQPNLNSEPDLDEKSSYKIRNYLYDEGLIIIKKFIIEFSPKGKTFIDNCTSKNGYYEQWIKSKQFDKKLEQAKNRKIINDAILSNWSKYTYWITFIMALFAFLYSLYSIFLK